jgi:predicted metalloprotease
VRRRGRHRVDQDSWSGVLGADHRPTDTVSSNGSVPTACGEGTSGSGPFHCPGDQLVYNDLSFLDTLPSTRCSSGSARRAGCSSTPT